MADMVNTALATRFLENALAEHLRTKLREHFEKQAAPVIKEMVDACVEDLKLTIGTYRDNFSWSDIIKIVVEHK